MSTISPFIFAVALFAIICVQSIDGATVLTLNQQCVNMGFAGVCRSSVTKLNTITNRERCTAKVRCAIPVGTGYYSQTAGVPQNGTPCGSGMICLSGRCLTAPLGITYEGSNSTKNCGKNAGLVTRIKVKTTPQPEM